MLQNKINDENRRMDNSGNKGLMYTWLSKKSDDKKTTIKSLDTNSQEPAKEKLPKKKSTEIVETTKTKTSPKTTAKVTAAKSKKAKNDDDDFIVDDLDEDDAEDMKMTKKNTKAKSKATKGSSGVGKLEIEAKKPTESKTAKKTALSPNKDEEKPAAKKKGGSQYYAAYMRREGPKNPGSKPIPIGKKGCFEGLKFLVTGVLDSLDRDQCKSIIEKYGGSLVSGVTKKLDYLIVGEDAGKSKLEKADELNIKQVNEDEFLKLICTKSNITNPKYENETEMMDLDEEEKVEEKSKVKKEPQVADKKKTTPVKESKTSKMKRIKEISDDENSNDSETVSASQKITSKMQCLEVAKNIKEEPTTEKMEVNKISAGVSNSSSASSIVSMKSSDSFESKSQSLVKKESKLDETIETKLWVDKYKPTSLSKIIGQNTEKSNANKLVYWLKNWQKWHSSKEDSKAKKSWNDQDTGSSFKAALLSGPPGIGKTTTATLACKELGFTYVELNASDSRSKKLLDSILGNSIENCSIESYFTVKSTKEKSNEISKDKHCIIMDEVDGMAGNEDRGGVQELINTIKQSKIPIICICNDRQHVKIRSLANYCFDLRFYKPRLEQIRGSLMSVCFKEGVKISTDLLDQIIIGSNYDIRQCLYNLSMWSSNNKNLTSTKDSQKDIENATNDIRMNPFEACKLTFQHDQPGGNKSKLSIIDRMDLFFTDYSLLPLLVQENYLSVRPTNLKETHKVKKDREYFTNLSDTMESLCHSDRIGRILRTNNNWSLLPTQAIFTTLLPGEKVSGTIGLPAFPSWFGKHSKQGRVDRILQELQKHMRLHISANKIGVGLDYLPILKYLLSKPLIKKGTDGIEQVIKIMNDYYLTREDFDTILELATWPGQKDTMSLIDSKVKASFTRAYNKESHMNPFCIVSVKKLKGTKFEGDENEEDMEEEEEENEDDISSDAMIKAKKKTATKPAVAVKRAADKNGDSESKPTANKRKKV